jgi:hypothetical protein
MPCTGPPPIGMCSSVCIESYPFFYPLYVFLDPLSILLCIYPLPCYTSWCVFNPPVYTTMCNSNPILTPHIYIDVYLTLSNCRRNKREAWERVITLPPSLMDPVQEEVVLKKGKSKKRVKKEEPKEPKERQVT